jgi:hypothetical protein
MKTPLDEAIEILQTNEKLDQAYIIKILRGLKSRENEMIEFVWSVGLGGVGTHGLYQSNDVAEWIRNNPEQMF